MKHYCCFKIFIPSTVGVCLADTIRWFHRGSLKLHILSKDKLLRGAIDDLYATLQLSFKNNIQPPEGTTSRKALPDLNAIFNNLDQCDPPTKPPTRTDVPRVKVQSNYPTIFPKVQPHSNYTIRVPRVKPPAATPSPQTTLQRSKRICNHSKPIVSHNVNSTIHLSDLKERFMSDMMNSNAVLEPTTGDLLELRQLFKTPESKRYRYVAFHELARP